ncbi:NUDIX hydrolase [Actinoalloteichus fjordicus]|uniref:Isopentenyldiphosphate isomerase n=1 Tax=Actinoalloteichus fjordicus TaxID=1612552 RepID=A0AAC9PS50_9PSEU|nr:NUDIX domain-containing protein [Actinoalloteichus fjordicus]APU14632.1 isopentenyldiphosphate isomerase [Actinoalloteichus fjordicus]
MGTPDELVAVFDATGSRIGATTRADMRARSLWHAASSVLVRSGNGRRVYVHRRTETKDVFPGRYDCWAGGVLGADEEMGQCARRELAEELGVSGTPLVRLFDGRYESDTVRLFTTAFEVRWDGPIRHQLTEIAEGGWLDLAALRAKVADPAWPMVPDGRELARRWLTLLDAGEFD